MGSPTAPIQLVEFSDLECPVCKSFHQGALADIRRRYGDKLTINFIHFPLNIHRSADIAARAAECSARQGRFSEFIDTAYANQGLFSTLSWTTVARRSGVRDTAAFTDCLLHKETLVAVDSGLQLATRLGLRGTPTLFLNGWKIQYAPSTDEITADIEAVLMGRKPDYKPRRAD